MQALCLLIAGALRATLPGNEFTLVWQHSVQKTQWVERYRIADGALVITEARVQGSGAGMEPASNAQFEDGWWVWTPTTPPLRTLEISESSFAADYELCTRERCAPLREWTRSDASPVTLRACMSDEVKPPR